MQKIVSLLGGSDSSILGEKLNEALTENPTASLEMLETEQSSEIRFIKNKKTVRSFNFYYDKPQEKSNIRKAFSLLKQKKSQS